MNRLQVVIVEDEALARERLSRLLGELDCQVVAEHEDGRAFLDWLPQAPRIDGLFLDIQMPGGTGMEVLAELPTPLPVVFVTAYAEHAVRAFETEAVDFVLKPVFKDRLERSVARLRARKVPLRTGAELVALAEPKSQRFLVKAGGGNLFMDLRKVSHFEVVDEIVWAWAGGKRFRTTWTALSEVEAAFPETGLLRIQRHILLRRESVQGYRSLPGGRWKVRISEGLELEVSRTMTPRLREVLGLT
jgi:two-component system LytT family response regulator/two-component system response regulator AlgR